ncbi:putative aliphatic sulfonates transport permease protein SsuC [compost metagenome]
MNFVKRLIPIIAVLIVWSVASKFTNPLFLPAPSKTFQSFMQLINNGMLFEYIWSSFFRITTATLLSALISIPIGLLVANYKMFDNVITPVTSFMRFLPATAFYPLLIMWVGIGEPMKISFLFVATFFYFLPTVILGIKEVSVDLVDTAKTMGMSNFKVMTQVLLPAAIPSICQSFLMMYGIGWTYVIIAEAVNTNSGLGYLMNVSSARGRTDLVFVALISLLIVSYVFDNLGNFAIKKIFKWKFIKQPK